MAWNKLGSETLVTAGDNLTNTITATKFMQTLQHLLTDGVGTGIDQRIKFDSDGGANYAIRARENGLTPDDLRVNQSSLNLAHNIGGNDQMYVWYTANISGEETLVISHVIIQGTVGAGSAPSRQELVGKYTAHVDTTIASENLRSGSFDTDSNMSTLGSD